MHSPHPNYRNITHQPIVTHRNILTASSRALACLTMSLGSLKPSDSACFLSFPTRRSEHESMHAKISAQSQTLATGDRQDTLCIFASPEGIYTHSIDRLHASHFDAYGIPPSSRPAHRAVGSLHIALASILFPKTKHGNFMECTIAKERCILGSLSFLAFMISNCFDGRGTGPHPFCNAICCALDIVT